MANRFNTENNATTPRISTVLAIMGMVTLSGSILYLKEIIDTIKVMIITMVTNMKPENTRIVISRIRPNPGILKIILNLYRIR